jgi:hypothetical protein
VESVGEVVEDDRIATEAVALVVSERQSGMAIADRGSDASQLTITSWSSSAGIRRSRSSISRWNSSREIV